MEVSIWLLVENSNLMHPKPGHPETFSLLLLLLLRLLLLLLLLLLFLFLLFYIVLLLLLHLLLLNTTRLDRKYLHEKVVIRASSGAFKPPFRTSRHPLSS